MLDENAHQVRQEFARFQGRKRTSKKQLQSLAGKLNFCASVVYGSRVYSRRIIDTLNMFKAGDHKIKLSDDIRADITLWQSFMASFNGRPMLLNHQPVHIFPILCKRVGYFDPSV